MKEFDPIDYALHLEIMDKIEATRMGLWYMMMTRGQGHLAHHVLCDGFKSQEFLRHARKPLWEMNTEEFARWHRYAGPYMDTLEKIHAFMHQAKMASSAVQKVWQHLLWARGLGHADGYTPNRSATPQGSPASTPQKEGRPCESVPSAVAKESSAPGSLPAGNTGPGCPPDSGQGSGTVTTPGKRGESEVMNSDEPKRQSSRNTKHKRGKGWPKRPNPYTKPKKGKA